MSCTKRVVVTDHSYGELDIEEAIVSAAGCALERFQCRTEAESAEVLRGADVALVQMAPVGAGAVEAMNKGATIVRYGAGYDNVDVDACRKRGVALANVPDYGTEEVAVHAMALLLSLVRRLADLDASVRDGRWESSTLLRDAPSADGITLGLVGAGRIGLMTAGFAQGFSMKVIAFDPHADETVLRERGVEPVPLGELLRTSDAVSVHAPLTEETRHIIDADALASMKDTAVLVNCSRGALVDGAALAQALSDGTIAGAGLDVFEEEPLPAGDPLRSAPNLMLTPHAAWCAKRPMRRLRELAAEEAARAIKGEPLRSPVPLG